MGGRGGGVKDRGPGVGAVYPKPGKLFSRRSDELTQRRGHRKRQRLYGPKFYVPLEDQCGDVALAGSDLHDSCDRPRQGQTPSRLGRSNLYWQQPESQRHRWFVVKRKRIRAGGTQFSTDPCQERLKISVVFDLRNG